MTEPAYCDCGKMIEVSADQAGGIVNCPGCGKAVDVPGLRDPLWRLLQAGALLAVVGGTWLAGHLWGPSAAVVGGLGLAFAMWLVSRAL